MLIARKLTQERILITVRAWHWVTTRPSERPYPGLTSFEAETEKPWRTFYPRRRGLLKAQDILRSCGRPGPSARLFAASTDWERTFEGVDVLQATNRRCSLSRLRQRAAGQTTKYGRHTKDEQLTSQTLLARPMRTCATHVVREFVCFAHLAVQTGRTGTRWYVRRCPLVDADLNGGPEQCAGSMIDVVCFSPFA